jgi:hypothetical protein
MVGLLVWTAAGLPGDRRSGVLTLNLTKPATTLEQVVGRAVGVGAMAVLMVACFTVLSLAYLHVQGNLLMADARQQLATQEAAYAADPSAVNFPNPNLKRVVSQGALVSLDEVLPLAGEAVAAEDVDDRPGAAAVRDRRLARRMHVGAAEEGVQGRLWIRGGTRERAVFDFPEMVCPSDAPPPTLLISVLRCFVEPGEGLPTLGARQDGRDIRSQEIEVELELRTERGTGYHSEKVKLDDSGRAAVPVRRQWGVLTDEYNRCGGLSISLICTTKAQVAIGVSAESVRLTGRVAELRDGGQRVVPLPSNRPQVLDAPFVVLNEVEGSSWIRGEGRTAEDGRFLPSSEIAWADFDAIDLSRLGPDERVPLRITCRAMARHRQRDPATGGFQATEGRVIVVPHDRARGPVGQLPADAFEERFVASQVGDHWILVDRGVVSRGPFRVFLQCITDGHAIGLTEASVAVVLGREPFWLNLLRAELTVLAHLVSVIGLASLGGSLLNRPLAIVGSSCWYVFGLVAPLVAHTIFFTPFLGEAGTTAFSLVLRLFPQYGQLDASAMIRECRSIDWATVGGNLASVAGYGVCHLLLAAAILRSREVN